MNAFTYRWPTITVSKSCEEQYQSKEASHSKYPRYRPRFRHGFFWFYTIHLFFVIEIDILFPLGDILIAWPCPSEAVVHFCSPPHSAYLQMRLAFSWSRAPFREVALYLLWTSSSRKLIPLNLTAQKERLQVDRSEATIQAAPSFPKTVCREQ